MSGHVETYHGKVGDTPTHPDLQEFAALAQGLIVQAARIRVRLNELNADIEENGLTEEFRQSEKQQAYIRTRPEAELFVKLDKNYQAIIRQLNDLVPEETGGPSKLGALLKDE